MDAPSPDVGDHRQPGLVNGVHIVIGGSGGTGAALVAELVRRGLPVRAVGRRRPTTLEGVEAVSADISDPAQALESTRGATVIYQAAQPPYDRWATDFPPMQQALLAAAQAHGAKLVMADNLYLYGPSAGPMTEETPSRATGKKGLVRAQMADQLMAAHREGRARVAVGRSSDYFGPGGTNSVLGDFLFGPAVAGKTPRWLGSLDIPHSVSFLSDMAVGLATLGERSEADGQIWHLPINASPTGREFLSAVWRILGQPPRMGALGTVAVRLAGLFSLQARELQETLYQWRRPFLVDSSKWQRTFGPYEPVPFEEALEQTVAWYITRASVGGDADRARTDPG